MKKGLFGVSLNIFWKALVLPMFIIYLVSVVVIVSFSLDYITKGNKKLLSNIVENSNANMELITSSIASIANNKNVHNLISTWTSTDKELKREKLSGEINSLIGVSLNNFERYKGIVFNLKNGEKYVYGKDDYSDKFKEALEKENFEENKVSLVNKCIYDEDVILTIPISVRLTMVKNIVLIVDNNLFRPKEVFDDENLKDIYIVKENKYKDNLYFENGRVIKYYSEKLNMFDLSIAAKYDFTYIMYILIKISTIFLIGIGAMLLLIMKYYKKYMSEIIKPITNTVNTINSISDSGNLKTTFEKSEIQEIDDLNNYLNVMVNRVDNLMKENQKINDEKLKIEIKALQSQIAPHFIFNTLNSIRIQAVINGDKEVANHIKDFSSIVKKSFDKGNIHTFSEEIDVIKSYLNIMSLRYGDGINVDIDVEESIINNKILKLMIQPIIENSIMHGLANKGYCGNITIKAYESEENIIVEIRDNGIGISHEGIMKIMNGKGSGIGVYNTNRRIKIYYGENYGINIESKVGEYTITKIILPKIN